MPVPYDKFSEFITAFQQYDAQNDHSYISYGKQPQQRDVVTFTGQKTPNYKLVRKNRLLRPLPAKGTRIKISSNPRLTHTVVTRNPLIYPYPRVTTRLVVPMVSMDNLVSFDAETDRKARAQVLGNIRSGSCSVPTMIAEAGKTAQMVFKTATSLARCYRSLRHGDPVAAARALGLTSQKSFNKKFLQDYGRDASQAAANGWLTLNYGWKPLLMDIHNSAKALADIQYKDYSRLFFASGYSSSQSSGTVRAPLGASSRRVQSHSVKYGMCYTMADGEPPVEQILGLVNPLEVAWEVIPFSFVVDWFFPIGDYLQQLGAWSDRSHKLVWCYRTDFGEYEQSWVLSKSSSSKNGSGEIITYSDEWYATGHAITWERSLTGVPTPQIPRFKNPVSLSHAASALALLSTAFGR